MADLATKDLKLDLGAGDVLRDVSFTAASGRITALLGAPGSGKTALIRAIAGFECPHAGSIRIGDRMVFDAARRIDLPVERRGIGVTFQSPTWPPRQTVSEAIAFVARFAFRDQASVDARVGRLVANAGLADLAMQRMEQLSPAERHRVALARALVADPAVLLLDEPFSGLDAAARADARLRLRELVAGSGLTMLLATDELVDALALSDRIILLNRGTVEQEGTPAELHAEPATAFAASSMGVNNRIDAKLVEKAGPHASIEVAGARLAGTSRTSAEVGQAAIGMIRGERLLLGGGPGNNRIPMRLSAQMYMGARWELTFVKDTLTVRAFASAPLRHEHYHVEFPPEALWIY
jgi:iron(III) transport system ATP-binding protein